MRIFYLDNLKALAIILVVIVHTGVTYCGMGSWFYIEHSYLDNASYYFFLFLGSFSQAFFMSLLFAIGGYFIPDSLAKRGVKNFIAARSFRLGMPALIFALLIFPICENMINQSFNLKIYLQGIISFKFIEWTGPLWFTLALLFFTFIYIAIKRWCDVLAEKYSFNITIKNVLVLVLIIGIVAFALRLIFPIGSSVLNFQLCFFSAYLFMFFMGVFARQKNIFDKINYQQAKKWFFISFIVGIPWWILIVYFGIIANGNDRNLILIQGGWNWISFSAALWESFFCVSIILGLIGIFKNIFNTQNSLQRFLSKNSFAVYVFHPPILIAVSLVFKNFVHDKNIIT
ncbi:MAG: acyltransferase [Parachlamydiales bacterium]|nr:acyltransferase [Parachlamydiales bacterium]